MPKQKWLNLETVQMSKREEQMLLDVMSNLPKMNDALKNEDVCDLETVRKMLALEVRTARRPATIGRLVGRFKTLLSREIDTEVYQGA